MIEFFFDIACGDINVSSILNQDILMSKTILMLPILTTRRVNFDCMYVKNYFSFVEMLTDIKCRILWKFIYAKIFFPVLLNFFSSLNCNSPGA